MRVVAEVILVAGACWFMLAGLGALRLRDPLARLHAATKATTLGLALIAAGAALQSSGPDAGKFLLAVVLVFLTAPVSAHLLGRATYTNPGGTKLNIKRVEPVEEPPEG